MAINGLGTDATSQIGASGLTGVKSVSIGPIEAEFSEKAIAQQISGDYQATTYGQQFKPILMAHNAGGLVSDSGYYTPYNYDAGQYVNLW